MATDINPDLARDMGFTVSDATADDLLIAVRATDVAAPRRRGRTGGAIAPSGR
jgi:hypothetical protein